MADGGGASSPPPSKHTGNDTLTLCRRGAVVIVLVLLLIWYHGESLTDLFGYHPMMMLLAFLGVAPEVALSTHHMRRSRSMAVRTTATLRHIFLALAMKSFALVGFCVIFVNKSMRKKHHFTSWHGLIGLITVLAVVVQVTIGLVYYLKLMNAQLALLRRLHRFMFFVVALLGSVSMSIGIGGTSYGMWQIHNPIVRWAVAVTPMAALAVAFWRE